MNHGSGRMSLKKTFNCPGEVPLSVMGGKWKVIILWLLRKGPQRSGRLKSSLPGISSSAFSKAVREMEQDGILKRTAKSTEPLQVSYILTPRGESLGPLVKTLVKWGLAHRGDYVQGLFGMETR